MFYEVICHCHCPMLLLNCMMTWNSIASQAFHNYHILHLNVVCIVAKTTMNCHSNLKTYLQFPYLHEEIDELDAPKYALTMCKTCVVELTYSIKHFRLFHQYLHVKLHCFYPIHQPMSNSVVEMRDDFLFSILTY